jgi:hypothetical protein
MKKLKQEFGSGGEFSVAIVWVTGVVTGVGPMHFIEKIKDNHDKGLVFRP